LTQIKTKGDPQDQRSGMTTRYDWITFAGIARWKMDCGKGSDRIHVATALTIRASEFFSVP
jgi:hypothetical protein